MIDTADHKAFHRFDALEQRLDEGFRRMREYFEAIYACLDRLAQQCAESAVIVRRIEAMLVRDRAA